MSEGLIVKSSGGFYYVKCAGAVVECRARGIFRKEGNSPLVGDSVEFLVQGAGTGSKYDSGTVEKLLPRKNSLVRPPVANLDLLIMVVASAEPSPNYTVIDRLAAMAEQKGIEMVIAVTKADLRSCDDIVDIYTRAGYKVFTVSGISGIGAEMLQPLIKDKLCAFSGNSGVGKSSILNYLDPSIVRDTGNISRKLGRGRHTTRTVELFEACGGYIADTPGFSAIDNARFEPILKDDLQYTFREFEPYLGRCRFTGCSHTKEEGCAVLEAVRTGVIPQSRHQSYCVMYGEAKNIKEWELKK